MTKTQGNTPLTPTSIRKPFAPYSHGVHVPKNKRIIATSGQLGISVDDVIPQSVQEQAQICFANIAAILAEGGMVLEDVIRLNAYVTDRSFMKGYMTVRDSLFAQTQPASTLMIVSGFTLPEFKVEIEAIAAAD